MYRRKHALATLLLSGALISAHNSQAACSYAVTSDWGSGFNAEISITNSGTTAVSNWSVNWEYSGSTRATSAWNAVFSGNNPYTASNLSWNGNLQPGATVKVGLGGTGPGEVPNITGSLCDSGSSSSSTSGSTSSTSSGSSSTSSSGGSSGGACTAYVAGASYSTGDLVTNVGQNFSCTVAGWCSSGNSSYEPGVGWAWNFAWDSAAPDACGTSSSSSSSSSSGGALPAGIQAQDIGSPSIQGSSEYSTANETYTITASGSDINGTSDQLHYTYGSLNGDGTLTVFIESISEPHANAKAGIMLRKDLSDNSPNTFMLLHPSKGSAFQNRKTTGGTTESSWQQDISRAGDDPNNPDTYPYRMRYLQPSKWLKMIRAGDRVEGWSSEDGLCWNIRWAENVDFGTAEIYAGVAVSSHSNAQTATVTAKNLQIENAVPEDINAQCERSQRDRDIPPPSTWIIGAGDHGADTWDYTLTNPNSAIMPIPCRVEEKYLWQKEVDELTCPDNQTQAWSLPGFIYTPDWVQNAAGGIGPTHWNKSYIKTKVNAENIWLRKEVTLSQEEIDDLIFWGRWDATTIIYVNGVIATIVEANEGYHHYLGLNDEARAALQPGVNVISARVSHPGNTVIVDFGVGLHSGLGSSFPRLATVGNANSKYSNYAEGYYQYTRERGIPGGVVGIQEAGQIVENHSFGWADVAMTKPMPANAVLRLASVDKAVTNAAIVKILEDTAWGPDDKVFGPTGVLSHISAMPTWSPGLHMNNITIDQMRTMHAGLTGFSDSQAHLDEIAFYFGIQTSELTSEHIASAIYSTNARHAPGAEYHYNSHGHFLLRYIVEVVSGKSFEEYLSVDMGASDIVIARERLADRHPNEADYRTVNNFETFSRWGGLDAYLALSSSAPGLASFFNDWAPHHERVPNSENFIHKNGGGGGAMQGTVSGLSVTYENTPRVSIVNIWNSALAPANNRLDDLLKNYTRGTCRPSDNVNQWYRIRSSWSGVAEETRIHFGNWNLQANTAPENQGYDARDSMWFLTEVVDGGQTYYVFKAFWEQQRVIYINSSSNELALDTFDPNSHAAQWALEDNGDHYVIRNRQFPDRVLNMENGFKASNVASGSGSTKWTVCH